MPLFNKIRSTLAYPKMKSFYSQFIKPGDICYDVGANIGNRTQVFLDLGANRVVAIEPVEASVKELRRIFGKDERVVICPFALGPKNTKSEIRLCEATTISSLSDGWIEATRKSGRFKEFNYTQKVEIEIRTFNEVIDLYGKPTFAKIDVEGYEYEVLQGLTYLLAQGSIEFTPEWIESALNCIDYLDRLGQYVYNFSLSESFKLELSEWVKGENMKEILSKYTSNILFGDVYFKKALNIYCDK